MAWRHWGWCVFTDSTTARVLSNIRKEVENVADDLVR